MTDPCMCGDTECPVCGVLQGTYGGEDEGDDPYEIDEPEDDDR